jgi:hypothetical protein
MQRTIDDCLALDANRLAKMGVFNEGRHSSVKWESGANIGLLYRDGKVCSGKLELLYNLEGEPNNQKVRISKAPCHFGGVRFYFHCPGCGERRYKLHLAGSGFYCRECYRMPYYTQECGHIDGLMRKVHKLEAKLENKPMRTKTRMRVIEQLCAAEDRVNAAFINRFGQVAAKQFGFY